MVSAFINSRKFALLIPFIGCLIQISGQPDPKEYVCTEVYFLSEYDQDINGYDLFYFRIEGDTVLIAGKSDWFPYEAIRNGEAEPLNELNNRRYLLPICQEGTSDFLSPGLAFRLPNPRGIQFFVTNSDSSPVSTKVSIPAMTTVYSTSSIRSGFILLNSCDP